MTCITPIRDSDRQMPMPMPLAQPAQPLRRAFRDADAPVWAASPRTGWWRLAVFVPALLTTAVIAFALAGWFTTGGVSGFEKVIVGLVTLNFFWICLGVSTALAGLLNRVMAQAVPADIAMQGPVQGLHVALLVPIYNEVPADTMGNAAAMLADLAACRSAHRFTLFILSDTQDDAIAAEEERVLIRLRAATDQPVFYRRRAVNTDRKIGNITDWITRWGGAYGAMVVLDADSLMSAGALNGLADAMARDPAAGLIQSMPLLIGARSLFARLQQFSSAAYGGLLAEGLARWSDGEGNYWGHNAIIRTAAFARCAGLPRLPTRRGPGALIMSHDFVEAALLRRAGWAVRFLPRIAGSYEECPASLIDYALRDRRWCHGNMQHLRILGARSLHPVSRFHLFQGAMSYLQSPVWFVLLIIWALLGDGGEASVISYFSSGNPLMPDWPKPIGTLGINLLLFMYALLLAPKLLAVLAQGGTRAGFGRFGGPGRYLVSVLIEIVGAIVVAPILMVQQVVAVLRVLVGVRVVWMPPPRTAGGRYGLAMLLRFHIIETVGGGLLVAGTAAGLVSLWLLPIALSLLAAVPLSALSGARIRAMQGLLETPETVAEPQIVARARHWRQFLRLGDSDTLQSVSVAAGIAAE